MQTLESSLKNRYPFIYKIQDKFYTIGYGIFKEEENTSFTALYDEYKEEFDTFEAFFKGISCDINILDKESKYKVYEEKHFAKKFVSKYAELSKKINEYYSRNENIPQKNDLSEFLQGLDETSKADLERQTKIFLLARNLYDREELDKKIK